MPLIVLCTSQVWGQVSFEVFDVVLFGGKGCIDAVTIEGDKIFA